ncbi:MAG: patatin-like phospholipase family protein, partial [Acidimicrobiales bacterium]
MRLLGFVWLWARRLPIRFTAVLVALMLLYLVFVSWLVSVGGETTIADALWNLLGLPDIAVVRVFWEGLVVVAILVVGVLVSYNLTAWVYRKIRHRVTVVVPAPVAAAPRIGTRLDGFNRIGIILAGGGAKGAYQAGAMKAIHEFLERNGGLDKVAMIAGTSIGSWNAMFWLAGLVKPPAPGARSLHEQWWRTIGVERIVEFDTYLPLRRNHFLLPTPWREAFRQIFLETPAVRDRLADLFVGAGSAGEPRMRFYFTRSNVERGHLEFATNWPGIRSLTRPNFRTADPHDAEPVVQLDRYEVIEGDDVRAALGRTELAVFASMDLPPLFPYMRITVDVGEGFEDGGV